MASLAKKIPVVMQSSKSLNSNSSSNKTQMTELSLQKTRWLIYIFSTILFGIASLFFIVGILYLTTYFYPYAFTAFSTTLCAGLFIAFAGVLLAIIAVNVFFVRTERNGFVIFTTFGAIALFAVLIGIGAWGWFDFNIFCYYFNSRQIRTIFVVVTINKLLC